MSQNSISEYHIPNDAPGEIESLTDYARQVVDSAYVVSDHDQINEIPNGKVEQSANQTIEELRSIGSAIESSREKELDLMNLQSNRHITDVSIFIKDISQTLFGQNSPRLNNREIARDGLIAREGETGAKVFGLKTDKTQRHEFFFEKVDEEGVGHWFFYSEENIVSPEGYSKHVLHYEVQPRGVFQVGLGYLEGYELNKFKIAAEMYKKLIDKNIYSAEAKTANNDMSPSKNKILISKNVLNMLVNFPNRKK